MGGRSDAAARRGPAFVPLSRYFGAAGGEGWTFEWNAENRMVRAESATVKIENRYDNMGRRVSKLRVDLMRGCQYPTLYRMMRRFVPAKRAGAIVVGVFTLVGCVSAYGQQDPDRGSSLSHPTKEQLFTSVTNAIRMGSSSKVVYQRLRKPDHIIRSMNPRFDVRADGDVVPRGLPPSPAFFLHYVCEDGCVVIRLGSNDKRDAASYVVKAANMVECRMHSASGGHQARSPDAPGPEL